ncbi:MAG: three-Cys-motif partner protein TcmP [Christensenellales bacterium]
MAKKNDSFFVEKKAWSAVKDELLGCYFKPYVSKILHTYKPLIYVDCFAGKGKFEDGNDGSPLIALKIIDECCASTKMKLTQIETAFIDLHYADDLKENLKAYPWAKIVSGKYENNIKSILRDKENYNVFLYIDPYGIKALQCSFFDSFAKGQFNSIELLINMNSFGFIREACHAFGTVFDDKALFDDLVEYEPTIMDASDNSIRELNEIAGGDYWQPIIEAYKKGKINGYEAEVQFSEQYCMRLKESYTYVLNMPLRIKRGQRPKYRLIHATNHRDGCLLMVDNICNRWEALQEIQYSGQMTFWSEDFDNQIVDENDIKAKALEHFSQYINWTSLHDALAVFFMKHGPICSTGDVKKSLKIFEKEGRLAIVRNPKVTIKGKPTAFMSEKKGKTVSVRWIE